MRAYFESRFTSKDDKKHLDVILPLVIKSHTEVLSKKESKTLSGWIKTASPWVKEQAQAVEEYLTAKESLHALKQEEAAKAEARKSSQVASASSQGFSLNPLKAFGLFSLFAMGSAAARSQASSDNSTSDALTSFKNSSELTANSSANFTALSNSSAVSGFGGKPALNVESAQRSVSAAEDKISSGVWNRMRHLLVPIITPAPTTFKPTIAPSSSPTTDSPSAEPLSNSTTNTPSFFPTSLQPTVVNTTVTEVPSEFPSFEPSPSPSTPPSKSPSTSPSEMPTMIITTSLAPSSESPTPSPSSGPSQNPSVAPSISWTVTPTNQPTPSPTKKPTSLPSQSPTIQEILASLFPTQLPTTKPIIVSQVPSANPTQEPTQIFTPTSLVNGVPTLSPTSYTASPTGEITSFPTSSLPTSTPIGTLEPTSEQPSENPSNTPSGQSSNAPSFQFTSFSPSSIPSFNATPVSAPTRVQDNVSNSLNFGLIVGAAGGGLALIGVVAAVICFCRRKRLQQEQGNNVEMQQNPITRARVSTPEEERARVWTPEEEIESFLTNLNKDSSDLIYYLKSKDDKILKKVDLKTLDKDYLIEQRKKLTDKGFPLVTCQSELCEDENYLFNLHCAAGINMDVVTMTEETNPLSNQDEYSVREISTSAFSSHEKEESKIDISQSRSSPVPRKPSSWNYEQSSEYSQPFTNLRPPNSCSSNFSFSRSPENSISVKSFNSAVPGDKDPTGRN